MEVWVKAECGGKRRDLFALFWGAASRRACGSHVAGPESAAQAGGGAAEPSLSALRLFPAACRAPLRSSTARGRARLPGGGAHWPRRGSEGGGPAASWLPLGHSRG